MTCSQVVGLISRDEYRAAGLLRRFGIRVHLLLCKYCAGYLRQLRTVARAARDTNPQVPEPDVEQAKSLILKRLSGGPPPGQQQL